MPELIQVLTCPFGARIIKKKNTTVYTDQINKLKKVMCTLSKQMGYLT